MKLLEKSGMTNTRIALLLAAAVLISAIVSPYLLKVLEKADHINRIKEYRNSPDYLHQLETSWERKECFQFEEILRQIETNMKFGLEHPDNEKLQLYRIVRDGACATEPKTPH